MKTLLLIDGHAMIHRAYHALPESFVSADGTPTNAILGFFLMLQKVLGEFHPSHLAVCFDTPKRTFRKELFEGYQAKRPPMIDGLKVQIPFIKELLTKGGISCLEKEGFEADDVIGTLATRYKGSFDRVLILTGDRDILQLVDTNVFVITPKKGVSVFALYTPEEVGGVFGVDAAHIPDYKAIAGDASDNYNTARGIGPKTALKLLAQFGNVENMLQNIDAIENLKWREIIQTHKETVALFKKIATIDCAVDVPTKEEELAFRPFDEAMKDTLRKLSLHSLVNKLFEVRAEPKEKPPAKKAKSGSDSPSDQIGLF